MPIALIESGHVRYGQDGRGEAEPGPHMRLVGSGWFESVWFRSRGTGSAEGRIGLSGSGRSGRLSRLSRSGPLSQLGEVCVGEPIYKGEIVRDRLVFGNWKPGN